MKPAQLRRREGEGKGSGTLSTTVAVDFFCIGLARILGEKGPEVREDRVRTFAKEQVLVFGATTLRQFRKFVVENDEPYYDSLNELPKIVSPARSRSRSGGRTRRFSTRTR